MDRKVALIQLQERVEEAKPLLKQKFTKLVEEHYEELVEELYQGIRKLDEQYPIRVVQFQLMRSDIYSGKCNIRVCGYNENWYLDENRTEAEVAAEYLYEPFQELINKLSVEISVYMGSVTEYDIRNLVCEFFMQCFCEIAVIIRQRFLVFDEWALENKITWKLPYRIVWGEYCGKAETLFYLDNYGKKTEDFRKECMDENVERKEANLFKSFVQSEIKEIQVQNENFAFLNLKDSCLSQVSFMGCTFGQAMFRKSVMEWCSYETSRLYGCNFNETEQYQTNYCDARLINCCMEEAKIRKAKFDNALLEDISFWGTALEECSFRNAKMKRVDLRACNIQGIDLTDAELEQVYVQEKDIEALHLSPEQSHHVYVLKEEADAVL